MRETKTQYCQSGYKSNLRALYGNALSCFNDMRMGLKQSTNHTRADEWDDGAGVYLQKTNILVAVVNMQHPKKEEFPPPMGVNVEFSQAAVLQAIQDEAFDEFADYPEWTQSF